MAELYLSLFRVPSTEASEKLVKPVDVSMLPLEDCPPTQYRVHAEHQTFVLPFEIWSYRQDRHRYIASTGLLSL